MQIISYVMVENFLGEKVVNYKVRDGGRIIEATSENIEKTTANSVENICGNICVGIGIIILRRMTWIVDKIRVYVKRNKS